MTNQSHSLTLRFLAAAAKSRRGVPETVGGPEQSQ